MATSSSALRKLQSGQQLTDAERRILNLPVEDRPAAPAKPAITAKPAPSYNPLTGMVAKPAPKVAPTSGVVPNFTPSVVMPKPAVEVGQKGFVGPVAKTTPEAPTWTKVGTVQTINGPVDVDANGVAKDGTTPIAATPAFTGDRNIPASEKDTDAFALLKETFRLYDLEDLFPAIEQLMRDDVGPEQASLLLKTDSRYNTKYVERFSGNEARRKAGLNTLSEAEYLALEDSYTQTLQAYGLPAQLGVDRKSRQTQMASLIGSNVSATEFKGRIQTVVDRVQNADPSVKSAMTNFYGIKDSDLVSYFLNPKEGLPKLQEKVTAAEIGAAATMQNLATSKDAAEALAQFGITKEEARTGYATIGEVMPTATKLGQIYGDQYTQQTAEQEVFQGLASAKRKRQQLAEREVASFSGSSGRMRTGRPQGNTGQF